MRNIFACIVLLVIASFGIQQKVRDSPMKTRTLVLIDNMMLHTTHSTFFKDLKSNGHNVKIDYVDPSMISHSHIKLASNNEYLFDNLILMCTTLPDFPTTKEFNVRKFFDDGGNVFFVGDYDTSDHFRDFVKTFGFTFSPSGSYTVDYKHSVEPLSPNVFTLNNINDISFLGEGVKGKVLYNGIGLGQTHFENIQTTVFVRGNLQTATITYGANGRSEYNAMGRNVVLVLGIQGFNNARCLVTGSLDMLSNQLYSKSKGANRAYVNNLAGWLSHERGMLREVDHSFKCTESHGDGAECFLGSHWQFELEVVLLI